jgi:diguanylate cyclase (GGDEF)-like protein
MAILIVVRFQSRAAKLEATIKSAGYDEVYSASTIGSALTYLCPLGSDLSSTAIDLILMDVDMPDMDGVALCRFLKSTPHLCDIPIIMLSDKIESSSLEAAFDAGAYDYLSKPFHDYELLARMRAALRLREEIEVRKTREKELTQLTHELKLSNRRYEEANRALLQLSIEDPLTGIANRRFFDANFDNELRSSIRRASPMALGLIDVDYFKLFNDVYGHQAGDECLRSVALTIKTSLSRAGDFVARYGGEEFVVLLPETEIEGGKLIGERIRSSIENVRIPHSASKVSDVVTISLGMTVLVPEQGITRAEIIASADQELYKAKSAGRNCCSVSMHLDTYFNDPVKDYYLTQVDTNQ